MALSGFIKQLLETDSVFGSEAKKLTGINDGGNEFTQLSADSYKPDAQGVELFFSINYNNTTGTATAFSMQLPQFGDNRLDLFEIPEFLTAGKFIKINIFNFATATDNRSRPDLRIDPELVREVLTLMNGSVFLIESSFTDPAQPDRPVTNPRLFLRFSLVAADAPRFLDNVKVQVEDKLPSGVPLTPTIGPLDYTFDGRIGSIINDPRISTLSSGGSTHFNLDNVGVGLTTDRGSGIASKYASHYHGDKLINLVTNTRDDQNQPLYGIQFLGDTENTTQVIVPAEIVLDRQGNVVFSRENVN